jgi:hypothetical protein
MGGSGSGRRFHYNAKRTTESTRSIDIRWLKKQGYLIPHTIGTLKWQRGNKQTGFAVYYMEADLMIVSFPFLNGGEWEAVAQKICFDKTPCNYGGSRSWFLCPDCSKRVAVLYGAGKDFLCRHCYKLTYSSQQECREYRLLRKARNIRCRLGGSNNKFMSFPWKPKNMHWKTYWRLRTEAVHTYSLSLSMAAKHLGLDF